MILEIDRLKFIGGIDLLYVRSTSTELVERNFDKFGRISA